MRRYEMLSGLVLLICGGVLLVMAPDSLAMLIVGVMDAMMAIGFFVSIMPSARYSRSFVYAVNYIERMKSVPNESTWVAISESDVLFKNDALDEMFADYKEKVFNQDDESDQIITDVEDYINEEAIELKTWQSVVSQIPNTLTGLGILGTFIGLIIGISNIRFSTVEVAVDSVQTLLSGISVAFYTSITGVILSIVYTMIYRTMWNMMLRNLNVFTREFHMYVLPSAEDQMRERDMRFKKSIMEKLDAISEGRR